MDDLEGYLRQGEPGKAERAKLWRTAIGLQQVDGLKPSEYLIATARQHIEGDITIEEAKQRIDSYYQQHPSPTDGDRTVEADKVSARITEMLGEQTFTFSPAGYITIHRRLFQDIYPFAGRLRDYNITQQEWVLNGETVLYASADSLQAALEHDLEQEKKFSYKRLGRQELVEHLAHFVSNLWQIHLFGEGNTRTTAVFLMKYLHKLGFKGIDNDLFAEHAWYFRNALVRANYEDLSKGVHKTDKFLIRFLSNLLLNEAHSLKNREMHVDHVDPVKAQDASVSTGDDTVNDTVKGGRDSVNDMVFSMIKKDRHITAAQISERLNVSLSTVWRKIRDLKRTGMIERIGSDKTGHWKIIEP